MSILLPLILLLSVVFCERSIPETLYVTENFFHETLYDLDPASPCAPIYEKYLGEKFPNLPKDSQDEIVHCLRREAWLIEKSNEAGHYKREYNTSCDIMMFELRDWSTLTQIEKRFLKDCEMNWIGVAQAKKSMPDLAWVPSTILNDPFLPYVIVNDVLTCFLINRQFLEDRNLSLTGFHSEKTKQGWESLGLSVEHYNASDIVDEESLERFRNTTTLEDYIGWNKVESCIAYDSIFKILEDKGVVNYLIHSALYWVQTTKEKIHLFNQ